MQHMHDKIKHNNLQLLEAPEHTIQATTEAYSYKNRVIEHAQIYIHFKRFQLACLYRLGAKGHETS
jgi:hypothetical protein